MCKITNHSNMRYLWYHSPIILLEDNFAACGLQHFVIYIYFIQTEKPKPVDITFIGHDIILAHRCVEKWYGVYYWWQWQELHPSSKTQKQNQKPHLRAKKNKKMPPLPRPTTIIHQPVPSTDFFKFIFLMYKPNEGINQNTCIPLIRIHAFHASTQMY